jgi:signal transduction histidine kinase
MTAAVMSHRLLAALPRGHGVPERQFTTRHGAMVKLLWAHAVALPLLALAYGYPLGHSLLEGAVVGVWAVAASLPIGRRPQALTAAFGLLTCSAVLVHITGGLIEAHFHFFVVVTALSLYEDWPVYGMAVGFVLLHHGAGPALLGGDHVYAHAGDPWKWAAIHTGFIAALCVVNVAVWRAAEHAREEIDAAGRELERRAADLERSNAELHEFAYVASHDLSEPLRMMTSYLQLLERRYGDRLDEDAEQFIGFAVDGARRMRSLIDDLLRYSRVESVTIEAKPVDLGETVDATLRALAAQLEETEGAVEVRALPVVSGDPAQMRQLFQNLISNALKFHGDSSPRVDVVAERDDAGWRFMVADNGIGIDPGHADRVFKMFQRLHTREEYDGTGIGLAICRKIVDRHGGRIWVEPNPGGGSRFVFTIPDAAEQRA